MVVRGTYTLAQINGWSSGDRPSGLVHDLLIDMGGSVTLVFCLWIGHFVFGTRDWYHTRTGPHWDQVPVREGPGQGSRLFTSPSWSTRDFEEGRL